MQACAFEEPKPMANKHAAKAIRIRFGVLISLAAQITSMVNRRPLSHTVPS